MKKTINLLKAGFESSSGLTPEFKAFVSVFKKEFKKELETINATNITFNKGHFYISGFFTVKGQAYYFSIPDVRDMNYGLINNPSSCMCQMLYRTANDYKDFRGGGNYYIPFKVGMAQEMSL